MGFKRNLVLHSLRRNQRNQRNFAFLKPLHSTLSRNIQISSGKGFESQDKEQEQIHITKLDLDLHCDHEGERESGSSNSDLSLENQKRKNDYAIRNQVSRLNLAHVKRHIFLCADQTKPKCCQKEIGIESWNYLKQRCKELNKEYRKAYDISRKQKTHDSPMKREEIDKEMEMGLFQISRTKANCLQVCMDGPIAVVYPDHGGIWYRGCTPKVLEEIIVKHLVGGKPVSKYIIPGLERVKF